MKFNQLSKLLSGAIVTIGLVLGSQLSAKAATFSDGWYYINDSATDGSNIWGIGNKSGQPSDYNRFEINGLAIKQQGTQFLVALSSYTPSGGLVISGNNYRLPTASDTNPITWGDLFLNFSGLSFNEAMSQGSLFGVRFDARNDSGVGLGVFKNVQAVSVASQNQGYSSLQSYLNQVGASASMGDININDNSYFTKSDSIKAVIGSGEKIGDVALVSDFSGTGLNTSLFNAPNGQVYGFSFDGSDLPLGTDFVASLLYECGNDGIGILASTEESSDETQDVPEPTGLTTLGLLGLVGFGLKRGLKK